MSPRDGMETNRKVFNVFLAFFCIGVGGLLFVVLRPYFYSALVALILYIATRKQYKQLRRMIGPRFEALAPWIMIGSVCMIVLLPSYFMIRTLIEESLSILFKIRISLSEDRIIDTLMSLNILTDLVTDNPFFWVKVPEIYADFAKNYIDILNLDSLYAVLSNASTFILGSIDLPAGILMNLFFSLLLLFFFYQDGRKIERFILDNLPFSTEVEEQVGRKIASAVQTVFKGNLIVSILQGVGVYILLLFAKISNPFLYASIAAFFSLIPVIGTSVVWLPIGLYLMFIENNILGASLFMASGLALYIVLENVVKPKMLDKKLRIHPLLIFLSLIGGIQEFGIMGLVLGPVTVTMVVILWDFWKLYRKDFFAN
ncbi:AI-2E family transporter [Leptospira wolffii]|uniref:AI-2E family transporter n=1 Tax=Leptospira wolffii TaxID=409998 RepID=A0ABV5BPK4_9LEPT|nr:PF01594 domain protein [Leptospira wolffii serovar Khorat str. Khorat-H2]TGL53728.1 AI-2E family transporter [Leptospira wolffii]